jgi:hypothetical protein
MDMAGVFRQKEKENIWGYTVISAAERSQE